MATVGVKVRMHFFSTGKILQISHRKDHALFPILYVPISFNTEV